MSTHDDQQSHHRINRSTIGENITRARQRAEMTQAELAELVGCNQSHVSKIEAGLTEPSIAILTDIAGILNGASKRHRVSAAALLAGVE